MLLTVLAVKAAATAVKAVKVGLVVCSIGGNGGGNSGDNVGDDCGGSDGIKDGN